MPARNLIRKFFMEFDMFSSYATFRTKGQPQTRNTCAGVASFLLLMLFIYLFIAQFALTANWQQIQSNETIQSSMDPSRNISNFMVAVGLEGFRIQGIKEYLRFQIKQLTKNGSKTISTKTLQTQKCRYDHWPELGQKIQQNFKSYNLQNKLCLIPGQDFRIERPSDGIYKILMVQANACRRMYRNMSFMYEDCADVNMTEYKNSIWIQYNKYFTANVVYLNTNINSMDKEVAVKTMYKTRMTFTIDQGIQTFVSLSTYEINTDTSIFPIQQNQMKEGYKIDQITSSNFGIVWYFQHASCTFQLSSSSIIINRKIGKIDEILSYAGGLFGIIIATLSIFMMSFNQYRYELMAAERAFTYDGDSKKIHEHDFTFIVYIKYQIYDWIKTLFCVELKWKDCKQIDEVREQAANQIDVALILKKMQYFQRFIEYMMSSKQKISLFLTEPPSLQQVRRNRMIAEYYDKIMQGQKIITIENINLPNEILQMGVANSRRNSWMDFSRDSEDYISTIERDDILPYSIQLYEEYHKNETEPELTEEQLALEREISFQFFQIPDKLRKRIQRKIPLKILKRLFKINKIKSNDNSITIKLDF